MKKFRVLIKCHDDGSAMILDAIVYEGKLWLVPEWIAGPDGKAERPTRLIDIDMLPKSKPAPEYDADLELLIPLSRRTLAGRGEEQNLDVIDAPMIDLGGGELH